MHRRPTLPPALVALACAAAVAHAHPGESKTEAACCQLTTSLAMDALRGGDLAGDERFFTTEGAPPNIHFLLANTVSMHRLPQDPTFWGKGDGCENLELDGYLQRNGWDPLASYPPIDPGTGLGSDRNPFPQLFQEGRFYRYMSWSPASLDAPPPLDQATADQVCQRVLRLDPVLRKLHYDACVSCLATDGYFIVPGATTDAEVVMSGKFLNFNPPKYALARKVLKEVMASTRRVRMGFSTLAVPTSTTPDPFGAVLGRKQNPTCKQVFEPDSSANWSSNRGAFVNAVNGVTWNAAGTLAEGLLTVGRLFCSTDSVYTRVFGFPANPYTLDPSFSNDTALRSETRGVCWGCQVTSVVILSDGVATQDSTLPVTQLHALNGGAVVCPDEDGNLLPDCGDGPNEKLDDVARFLATQDLQQHTPVIVGELNTAGKQSLSVYAVGLGSRRAPLLASAARVGRGEYYQARDARELATSLRSIIAAVETRATSFSAAAISNFQVNRTGGSILPRFKPNRLISHPWQGFLYRFELGSELLLGCQPAAAATRLSGGAGHPKDLNADGDCDDLHLLDANGDAVVEDDEGNFVLYRAPLQRAVPYWEAGARLRALADAPAPLDGGALVGTPAWRKRSIWTVVDTNGDNRLDAQDTPVEFSEANAELLLPYLGIASSAACARVASLKGTPTLTLRECAEAVIRYYRGADEFNPSLAQRGADRPHLLADIFHSSPVQVEPPIDRRFCGLTNQCLESLHRTPTAMAQYGEGKDTHDAYEAWLRAQGSRDKLVLVGSNGGMLHAFHSGRRTGTDPSTGLPLHDAGTGDELWAFVPPDLLPKLLPNVERHAYFVDNSAMVRDTWLDLNGDGTKQAGEFRTVAVVGTGAGGVHRFALDLTRLHRPLRAPGAAGPGMEAGDFLWMWPQPCDPLALQLGESQSNFAPRPPPIGPVAMEAPDGPLQVNGVRARERWVVMLNGGYDRYLSRGRGLAMVDLATGATLWSQFYGDGKPRSAELRYPIAAGVALLDVGAGGEVRADGDFLFDTAVVGDFGGAVWTVRFWVPGRLTDGRVSNWHMARAFQLAADVAQSTSSLRLREPFSFMAANILDPETGSVRTYLGTGDRYNLNDAGGPHCRLSNPRGCAQLGCEVSPLTVTVERGGAVVASSSHTFSGYQSTGTSLSTGATSNACLSSRVTLTWRVDAANGCGVDQEGTSSDRPRLQYTCDDPGGGWHCRFTDNDWQVHQFRLEPPPANTGRFYSLWSYGVAPTRRFDTEAEAAAYDSARLTDAQLVDVTDVAVDGGGKTVGGTPASALDRGWYYRYTHPDERTGTGTAILNGCVVWNTARPGPSGGPICAATGDSVARLYQAAVVSGAPNCAQSFRGTDGAYVRVLERTTVALPGEPAPQTVVIAGRVYSGIVTQEAGNTQGNLVSSHGELLQAVYQVEVEPEEHACRHEGLACR